MTELPKPPDLLETLKSFEVFQDVPDEGLNWLIDRSTYHCADTDEYLFKDGDPVNHMMVIISGTYTVRFQDEKGVKELGKLHPGHVTGILPFSRMKIAKAYGIPLSQTCVLRLHKDCFVEMVNVSYKLTQNLVAVMSTRIRDFTQLQSQNDKLMALGKISAGLAHELNNPASAMVRSADELHRAVHQTPERYKDVLTAKLTSDQVDQINAILFKHIEQGIQDDLSTMDRTDLEDDLLDWLEDHDIEGAEDIAETMADYGMSCAELAAMNEVAQGEKLPMLLWWLQSTLNLERLVVEIRESADRIASLIRSIKEYSHMDQSMDFQAVGVKRGIYNTLTMLKHEVKKKNIQIQKEIPLGLPQVRAIPGELNQVWTNIIDNAIDAMDREGTLHIRAYENQEFVVTEITDNGPGIPEEILNNIFDPFFTTKGIGKGTGMGLEITRRIINRHNGDITVKSEPGKTTFSICLPQAENQEVEEEVACEVDA